MRDLLERWQRHEAHLCDWDPVRLRYRLPVGSTRAYVRTDDPDAFELGDILTAVIEAVTARGWEWSLWSDGGVTEATITIPGEERRRFEKRGAGEPAIGLLLAYLAALEAVEGAS